MSFSSQAEKERFLVIQYHTLVQESPMMYVDWNGVELMSSDSKSFLAFKQIVLNYWKAICS